MRKLNGIKVRLNLMDMAYMNQVSKNILNLTKHAYGN